jgi:hypothetical protein
MQIPSYQQEHHTESQSRSHEYDSLSESKYSLQMYLVKLLCVEGTGAASDAKCHAKVFELLEPTAATPSIIGEYYSTRLTPPHRANIGPQRRANCEPVL